MNIIKNIFILAITSIMLFSQCKEPASLNAIVVTDQSGESGKNIQTILENTGLFNADIEKGNSPDFSNYDIVVLNVEKGNWADKSKEAFTAYVKNGGGVVVLGNSGNAFADWSEYQNIVGPVSKKSTSKSSEAYDFQVVNLNEEHPVTKGLSKAWVHGDDYMLYSTATLDGEVEILSTAKADTLQGGNGNQIPVLFTVQYGDGRVLHAALGNNEASSMQCVGFITTLQRGAEWAATGVVSQEVPLDFPNSVSTHTWVDFEPLTLDELFSKVTVYEIGKSKKYLTDISTRIRNSDGKSEDFSMFEDKILAFLASDATVDSKKYFCRELSWMGSEKSVTALEKLVNDKDLSEAASFALQRLRL
jgi:type 1 glutamine amidotransferase